jgi:hypothetical protein
MLSEFLHTFSAGLAKVEPRPAIAGVVALFAVWRIATTLILYLSRPVREFIPEDYDLAF